MFLLNRLFFAMLLLCVLNTGFATPVYPFSNVKQEAQFQHLLKSLRCVVCQNQDLADSNARLAVELRGMVYDRVIQGQSDQEIMHYLRARYGDFILFNPPMRWVTSLLWLGPGLFFLIGVFFFLRRTRDV